MKLKTPFIILLLVFSVLGVYYPSIFLPINSVDDERMINTLHNISHFSFKGLFLPGSSGYYYRPLLMATFIFDKFAWGFQESFMHLENILLHTINVILVFLIARKISATQNHDDGSIALAAALLFALHPINTEAVNWLSGRTDILAGAFVLMSLFFLLIALSDNCRSYCVLAAGSCFLGCLAKETAVFFYPAALALILLVDGGSPFRPSDILSSIRKRFAFHAIFTVACGAYLLVRQLAFARGDSGITHAAKGVIGSESNLLYTLKVIFKASGFYVKKLFYPFPLNFGIVKVSNYYIVVGIVLIIVLIYLAGRRNTVAALFIASFIVGSSAFLVAISRMAWTPLAERYMYIPCAMFSIAMVFVAASAARRYRLERGLVLFSSLLFSVSAYATVSRNIVWQDNLTLFQDTVNKSPEFQTAKNDLAAALIAHGRKQDGFRVLKSMESTPVDTPYNDLIILNRAMILTDEDKVDEARALLLDNLSSDRKLYGDFLQKLISIDGMCMSKTRDRKKILKLRGEMIDLLVKLQAHTSDPYYYYRIGQLYLFNNNKAAASKYFAKAYEAAPDDVFYKAAAKKMADKFSAK